MVYAIDFILLFQKMDDSLMARVVTLPLNGIVNHFFCTKAIALVFLNTQTTKLIG